MQEDTTRLSVPEASRRLGISQQAIWGRIARGDIPRYSADGYHVRVDLEDVTAWADRRRDKQLHNRGTNAERVVALRNEGYRDTHIASALGLSRQRIWQIRQRAGVARITLGSPCRKCGVRFTPDRHGQSRCVDHRRKPAEIIDIKCQECGTSFRRRESTIRATSPGHYCSHACRDHAKQGKSRSDSIPKICTKCHSEYRGLASARQSLCLLCRPKTRQQ
jgi:excisionase family DNA binding protein